jgi:hypothetical protein
MRHPRFGRLTAKMARAAPPCMADDGDWREADGWLDESDVPESDASLHATPMPDFTREWASGFTGPLAHQAQSYLARAQLQLLATPRNPWLPSPLVSLEVSAQSPLSRLMRHTYPPSLVGMQAGKGATQETLPQPISAWTQWC